MCSAWDTQNSGDLTSSFGIALPFELSCCWNVFYSVCIILGRHRCPWRATSRGRTKSAEQGERKKCHIFPFPETQNLESRQSVYLPVLWSFGNSISTSGAYRVSAFKASWWLPSRGVFRVTSFGWLFTRGNSSLRVEQLLQTHCFQGAVFKKGSSFQGALLRWLFSKRGYLLVGCNSSKGAFSGWVLFWMAAFMHGHLQEMARFNRCFQVVPFKLWLPSRAASRETRFE